MNSRWYKYTFLVEGLVRLRVFVFRCDCYEITSVAGQCSRQHSAVKVVLGVGSALNLLQVLAQIGISVGKAVAEVNGIVCGVESVRKS